ncbi:30S ribosomal protein S2 [bacterium]|nr:30S ribosomal protein S2 [bacterium]
MEVTIKELLESGVYFGHPTRQYDPRIKKYLYGKRQGIYIIDIEKTLQKIQEAGEFLKKSAASKKTILFVGTKRHAQQTIKESAEKCGMPYVNYRWIGGTLTNFHQIRTRIDRLEEIEELEKSGKLSLYTKKEVAIILKEKDNLIKKFGGIRSVTKFPDVIVVVDVRKEINLIREAKKVDCTLVGIVDTNSNPELVDYPIPANDDGLKSIALILNKLSESIIEGKTEAMQTPDAADVAEKIESIEENKNIPVKKEEIVKEKIEEDVKKSGKETVNEG